MTPAEEDPPGGPPNGSPDGDENRFHRYIVRMELTPETADVWVERWDRQQQRYAIGREERFTVIADTVAHLTCGNDRPLVVDLGCGPGSLAARLAELLPGAEIIGADLDPLLLELARARHGSAARYVCTEIGAPGWTAALGLDRPLDAAVSTTSLHCLTPTALARTYRQLARLIRPGGVLVNADHFPQPPTGPAELAAHLGRRRAERASAFTHEDWAAWWESVPNDPELAVLLDRQQRPQAAPASLGHNGLTLAQHTELLRAAGFGRIGPVWQYGDSCVLAALR